MSESVASGGYAPPDVMAAHDALVQTRQDVADLVRYVRDLARVGEKPSGNCLAGYVTPIVHGSHEPPPLDVIDGIFGRGSVHRLTADLVNHAMGAAAEYAFTDWGTDDFITALGGDGLAGMAEPAWDIFSSAGALSRELKSAMLLRKDGTAGRSYTLGDLLADLDTNDSLQACGGNNHYFRGVTRAWESGWLRPFAYLPSVGRLEILLNSDGRRLTTESALSARGTFCRHRGLANVRAADAVPLREVVAELARDDCRVRPDGTREGRYVWYAGHRLDLKGEQYAKVFAAIVGAHTPPTVESLERDLGIKNAQRYLTEVRQKLRDATAGLPFVIDLRTRRKVVTAEAKARAQKTTAA